MSELCPLDSRRSTHELWSKLALTHFTSIFAFCHLHSIRGERIIGSKLVFYFICPYVICLQHGLALLILFCASCIDLVMEGLETSRLFARARLKTLFGPDDQHPDPSDDYHFSNKERLPMSLAHPQVTLSWSTANVIGRLVVVLLFCVQCIGSIILFVRRCRHNAVTESDYRVLEIACGGLTIAISTLLFLVGQLYLYREEDMPHSKYHCWSVWAISCLRDSPGTNYENLFGLLVLFALRSVMASLIFAFKPTTQAFSISDSFISSPFSRILLLCILVAMLSLGYPFIRSENNSWICTYLNNLKVGVMWVLVCLGEIMFIFMLVDGYFTWSSISTNIRNLQEWPTNATCPGHWQDPWASWLWNLI